MWFSKPLEMPRRFRRRADGRIRRIAFGMMTALLSLQGTPACVAAILETHSAESPYQNGVQQIRVLLPDDYAPPKKYRVVYVLPAAPGIETNGAGLLECFRDLDLQNRFDVILATMSFEKMPWYGDHPTDPRLRQESYIVSFVVPFVESHYSTLGNSTGRLLIGFSKSGWGAFSLILRHPDFFNCAAAWDSPFMMHEFHFETEPIFGTLAHFARYLPDILVHEQRESFRDRPRFVLAGEDKFGPLFSAKTGGSATTEMHELMKREGVAHIYRPDLHVKHGWDKAWIEPVFKELMSLAAKSPPSS